MTRAQRRQCRLLALWLGPVSCHACGRVFTVTQVASTLESVFRGSANGWRLSEMKALWFFCAGYNLQKDGQCDPSLPRHLRPLWRCPRPVMRAAPQPAGEEHLSPRNTPSGEDPQECEGESQPVRHTANDGHVSFPAAGADQEPHNANPTARARSTMMYELKVVRERRAEYRGTPTAIRNAQDVYDLFRPRFERADREEFIVLLLDAKNRILGFHVVSVGSLTTSLVHPREVFKVAILGNAVTLVLVHNHPSGDPTPSTEDRSITQRLLDAGTLLGIRVLDHVIVGDGRYVSFVDDGLLCGSPQTAAVGREGGGHENRSRQFRATIPSR